jgi:serine phosphatase RsbU (regulator of sigma subunit)
MNKNYQVLFLVLCLSSIVSALSKTDSLISVLPKVHDTAKIEILIKLSELVYEKDFNLSLKYINQAKLLSDKNNLPVRKARCLQQLGYQYNRKGNLTLAIDLFIEASHIYENEKKYVMLAGTYNNLGATFVDKGDYQKSIEYLLKALRIYDSNNDEATKSKTLLNIGKVFYHQKNYKKALEYYSLSLELKKKLNDIQGLSLVYNNIGIVNYYIKNNNEAIESFKKSLKLSQQTGNIRGMSMPLFNIAEIYYYDNNLDSALVYYNKSYCIDTTLKDKANISVSLQKQAEIYLTLKKIEPALKFATQALKLSIEVDSKEDIKDSYRILSEIYAAKNNYLKALEYSNLCSEIKDSLYSKQSSEMIAELQTKYETEKKDLQLSKQKEKIKHQGLISKILISGIVIAILFTIMVLWQYFQKKRAFKILESQKKNITDSINYASRIQTALLPPADLLNKLLPEHFILYLPRDIVSGDFYWITISDGKTIIAVADCTGHGVPGAFMSMLGFAYLNEIVNKSPNIQAHIILNELREKVKTSLHQNDNSYNKDGMDIALAIIDHAYMKLQYAGANNPLVICRDSKIINIAPDKMPIGIHSAEIESFTLNEFNLEPNDIVYMFSDGYVDQFGGDKLKRLGTSKFEKILTYASKLQIKAQRYFLEEKILEWMIDTEQIDDILVLGVKI